eukprot:s7415_g1.t1
MTKHDQATLIYISSTSSTEH